MRNAFLSRWRAALRRAVCLLVLFVYCGGFALQAASASVDVVSGHYAYDTVDLVLGGRYPLMLQRHYQSSEQDRTPLTSYPGPFGPGTHMGLYSLRAAPVLDVAGQITKVRLSLPTGGAQLFATGVSGAPAGSYGNANPSDPIRGSFTVSGNATSSTLVLTLESGLVLSFSATLSGTRQLNSLTDRFGKAITFSYSGNNLTRVQDPFGRRIDFTYDATFTHQVRTATLYDNQGAVGGSVLYEYNSAGDLQYFHNAMDGQSVNNPDGTTRTVNGLTTYEYQNHYLTKITDPRGTVRLTNSYENFNTSGQAGRVTLQTLPGMDGRPGANGDQYTADDVLAQYVYSTGSTAVNDALYKTSDKQNWDKVTYNFDASTQQITAFSYAIDAAATYGFEYDPSTRDLTRFTNAYGQQTRFDYDGSYFRHLSGIELADSGRTSYSFTAPFGQIDSVTTPNNQSTYYEYNDPAGSYENSGYKGSLKSIADQLPENTSFEAYNPYGQATRVVDGQGRTTEFEYFDYPNNYITPGTANQDPHYITDPSGVQTCFRYDTLSRLKAVFYCYQFEQTNRWTEYSYDTLNRLIKITSPSDASNTRRITEFTYDDNSNVTSVKAPNGVLTTYTYDPMDRVATRAQAGRTEYFSYNNLGLLSKYKNARGQETLYEYGSKQRLRYVTFADGTKLTYSYNTLDQVASITDSSDASGARNVYFEYFTGTDQVSRLKTERIGTGETVRYFYDASGNLTSIKKGTSDASATPLINYDYKDDDASLATAGLCGNSTCDQNNAVVGFEYDPDGSLKSINYPNSIKEELFYNDGGEVERALFSGPGGTLLREIAYQYDYSTRGYLTSRTESGPSTPSVATSQSYSYNETGELTGATTPAGNYTNAYDKDGNLTSSSRPGASTTPSYEAGTNRMTAFEGGTLIYDGSGNLVEQNVGSTKVTFTYNARNQLSSYTNNAGFTVSFVYDALGRRMGKTISGTTTSYLLSGNQVIEQKTGSTTRRYLVGLGLDEVFMSREGSTDEYLLHDPLNNSVVAAVNGSTQAIKTGYGYSPFGQVTASNTSSNNLWLFAGAEAVNSASVVYHMRSRYYHAGNQRFMAEDPIGFAGGDTNLYRYLGNAPVTTSDPTGLRPDVRPRGVATLPGLSISTPEAPRATGAAESISKERATLSPSTISRPVERLAQSAQTKSVKLGQPGSRTDTAPGQDTLDCTPLPLTVVAGQSLGNICGYFEGPNSDLVDGSVRVSPSASGLSASISPDPVYVYSTFTVRVQTSTATPPGVYTLTADGYSVYDGTYYQPDSVTFEVLPPAPQINSISPGRGVTGSTVTLSGANLNYAPTVQFDNRLTATITSTSASEIKAIVPSGLPSYYGVPVNVTTKSGTSNNATFTVIVPPSISSFSPSSGKAGDNIAVTGADFYNLYGAAFNGTAASILSVSSSGTQMNLSVPSGASSGPISVSTEAGTATSPSSFTVNAPPSVSSLSPTAGAVGASVTVNGSNFTGASSVKFNATAAGFSVVSASQISATVPTGATDGAVSVTTAGGTASGGFFDVQATPTINSSGGVVGNPGSGVLSASASDTVLINGTNLNTLNSVTINGIAAYAVAVSATQIQVSLPENATTGPLVVQAAGVNLTASSSFKVNASTAPPSAHLDLVGVLGALQLLADVGGLIPGLNVPSAVLGIGASIVLGDAASAAGFGLTFLPFGGFAKAGVGLFKARTGLRNGIVAASRACGCFAEGTEVQTETGTKAIEKVEPGEKVLARNEKTGEQNLRRVQSTFQFDDRPVYRLELRETGGQGERDTLTVTGEHPFFLKDKGWTAAERLRSGERVQAVDGKWLRVVGLQPQQQRARTYNLEVEGEHTFFVGDTRAWVHNECLPTGLASQYLDVTRRKTTTRNIRTDVSVDEFRENLLDNGFAELPAIEALKGDILRFSKGATEYYLRSFSKSGPPTAELLVNGEQVLKLRLK
ncbi:IPT/TIG domain-containing protein [Gloeobacter violaceus]|nr:IPT/TIG domain-containing protein [Gloeobacter violaceus]